MKVYNYKMVSRSIEFMISQISEKVFDPVENIYKEERRF